MDVAVANLRLQILAQAEAGEAITDICKRNGISRTIFYRWRSRYSSEGLAGLVDRAPIASSHPKTLPASVAEHVALHALAHPSEGCRAIAAQLKARGTTISAAAVHKILKSQHLGSRRQRWLRLEDDLSSGSKLLISEQMRFLTECNPAINCRHYRPTLPGQILFGGIFRVDCTGTGRRVAVAAVMDGFSGYAYADAALSVYNLPSIVPLRKAVEANGTRPRVLVSEKTFRDNAAIRPVVEEYALQDVVVDNGSIGLIERFRPHLVRSRALAFASLLRDGNKTSLQAWVAQYNATKQDGFPCYGQAPSALNK